MSRVRRPVAVLLCLLGLSTAALTQDDGSIPTPPGLTNLREFIPLAHARFFGDAELTLVNHTSVPITVRPRWLVRDRGFVNGDPIVAVSALPQFLPIRDILPRGVEFAEVDGLEIAFQARAVMRVAAQVTLLPDARSQANQSLDVPPTIPVDVRGRRLEAVWSSPRHDEQAVVVLSNLASAVQSVSVTGSSKTERLVMEPWTVQSLTFPSRPASGVDWLKVEGDLSSLRATGFVMSPVDRVPRLIRFYDPQAAARSDVWANGVRLDAGPLAVLVKNTLGAQTRAKADLFDPKDGTVLVDFPAVDLDRGAAIALDLSRLPAAALQTKTATLRINSFSGNGSLVGAIQTMDRATGLQHDAPLRDSAWDNTSYRRGTGSCAWRLDGDYNTTLTITNVGDGPTLYALYLRTTAMQYVAGPGRLDVGASATVDFRKLRDAQTPDRSPNRRPLPFDADRGQCSWSTAHLAGTPRTGTLRMMGRAEIVSVSRRVSSTHSW